MRILIASDLHCDIAAARRLVDKSAEAEMVVIAGDFANQHEGLKELIDAIRDIRCPTVLVPGNNEREDALREACEGWLGATVLHTERTNVAGFPVYGIGCGIPPIDRDWSFDMSEDEAREKTDSLHERELTGGMFVTHSPPYGLCDEVEGKHCGSKALLEAIRKATPDVVVCGHIHQSWGAEANEGPTRVYNAGPEGRIVEVGPDIGGPAAEGA
ncbi:MAG: metallophosphoesterase family protein [Phycisphaerales bacterium]|nr:metallophosphoesterase family protein [Phycisphaerales bacterium]